MCRVFRCALKSALTRFGSPHCFKQPWFVSHFPFVWKVCFVVNEGATYRHRCTNRTHNASAIWRNVSVDPVDMLNKIFCGQILHLAVWACEGTAVLLWRRCMVAFWCVENCHWCRRRSSRKPAIVLMVTQTGQRYHFSTAFICTPHFDLVHVIEQIVCKHWNELWWKLCPAHWATVFHLSCIIQALCTETMFAWQSHRVSKCLHADCTLVICWDIIGTENRCCCHGSSLIMQFALSERSRSFQNCSRI